MMVLTMEKREQMEEIRGAETEPKVVEDKEGEGTWALVLVTESGRHSSRSGGRFRRSSLRDLLSLKSL